MLYNQNFLLHRAIDGELFVIFDVYIIFEADTDFFGIYARLDLQNYHRCYGV